MYNENTVAVGQKIVVDGKNATVAATDLRVAGPGGIYHTFVPYLLDDDTIDWIRFAPKGVIEFAPVEYPVGTVFRKILDTGNIYLLVNTREGWRWLTNGGTNWKLDDSEFAGVDPNDYEVILPKESE